MNAKQRTSGNFLLVLISLMLFSCGPMSPKDSGGGGQPTIQDYTVVDGSGMQRKGQAVEGSGSLVFREPLKTVQSKGSYNLNFSLKPDGSLKVISHSAADLRNGVELQFERVNGSPMLRVSGGVNGAIAVNLDNFFKEVHPHVAIGLSISVQNKDVRTGPQIQVLTSSDQRVLYDSAVARHQFSDRGLDGKFWGLTFKNARVNAARLIK